MAIDVTSRIEVFDQETFHALDKKLMRIVFDVHNKFGRFFDETLYKTEIAGRWVDAGFGTASPVGPRYRLFIHIRPHKMQFDA